MKYQIAAATTKTTRTIHHQFASPPAPAPAPAPGVDAVPGAVPGGVVVCASAGETTRTRKPNSVGRPHHRKPRVKVGQDHLRNSSFAVGLTWQLYCVGFGHARCAPDCHRPDR